LYAIVHNKGEIMHTDEKYNLEVSIENMIPGIMEHARLFYNEGWDELVESYSTDDVFNALFFNGITNMDDAIEFFHNRFNPLDNQKRGNNGAHYEEWESANHGSRSCHSEEWMGILFH
jgi:hypothetical protein